MKATFFKILVLFSVFFAVYLIFDYINKPVGKECSCDKWNNFIPDNINLNTVRIEERNSSIDFFSDIESVKNFFNNSAKELKSKSGSVNGYLFGPKASEALYNVVNDTLYPVKIPFSIFPGELKLVIAENIELTRYTQIDDLKELFPNSYSCLKCFPMVIFGNILKSEKIEMKLIDSSGFSKKIEIILNFENRFLNEIYFREM